LPDDIDYTMLKQMARRSRLLAFLHDNESKNPLLQSFSTILEPGDLTKPPVPQELSSSDIALFLSKVPKLLGTEYTLIQQYLHSTGRPYCSYTNLPHPEFALILPPNAKRLTEFHNNGRTYSCHLSHPGNSAIQFHDCESQSPRTGVIDNIFEIAIEGFLRKFILVQHHRDLNKHDLALTPYLNYPRMMAKVVETTLSNEIIVIEPHHIITHLTTFR
jgi:hypothetical protein